MSKFNDKDQEQLLHDLLNALGPVVGHLAFEVTTRSLGVEVNKEKVFKALQDRSKQFEKQSIIWGN